MINWWRQSWGETRKEARAFLVIAVFFTAFYWPATLAGLSLSASDSLVYSYPLRVAAWDAIRSGSLPLWTPLLLSGYPLLSMAQLGIGYPLTWAYLLIPGHWAEQIYILAPYLLAPAFTYCYARQIGRSRPAALLAGLSFTFGGMMTGGVGANGMLPNAVMWLPLLLVAVERSRTRAFLPCLLGATGAYAMSILSGIGQGFLYAGIIAVGYAFWISLTSPVSRVGGAGGFRGWLARWRPLAVCVGGMILAAGVAAFQILETMRAQRRSIRGELTYEVFSGGALTPLMTWKSLIAPFYHHNYEVTTFVAALAVLFALAGGVAALRRPRANSRALFWLAVAVVAWLLMLGDFTPLYRLLYHLPPVNRFRIPWRHAYEWSLAIGMLSSFGWDMVGGRLARQPTADARSRRRDDIVGWGLLVCAALAGYGWWRATKAPAAPGAKFQHTGLAESGWLWWKASFTLLMLLAVVWIWRRMSPGRRGPALAGAVALACFPEAYIMVDFTWFPLARPGSYFSQVSPSARFLQQFAPEQNRIYTTINGVFELDLRQGEPHNLSALRGFHNAAGYEPLMPRRYSDAFGNDGLFSTATLSSPLDRNVIDPRSHVLDLLNVKLIVEYAGSPKWVEKFGARFVDPDSRVDVSPGATVDLTGSAEPVDALSLVTTLANTGYLADGETVAKVFIHAADGRVVEREIKAGRDTAEWSYDFPAVKRGLRHSRAPIFESLPGDARNSFPAHRYWARYTLDGHMPVERVRISNLAQNAQLIMTKITLYDSTGLTTRLLTPRYPEHWRRIYQRDQVTIYDNSRGLQRAWLVAKAEPVSGREALRRIRGEGDFDPRESVLLEAAPGLLHDLPGGLLDSDCRAQIVSHEPNRLVIETRADQPAVLVVSESSYPGWRATIDGRNTSILTANYLLRGVILPAGRHRVEIWYEAPAARAGALISVLTIAMLAGAVVASRRRVRRPSWQPRSPR